MRPEQRAESAAVFGGEATGPFEIAKDGWDELGVDVDERGLEQVKGEHGHFGMLAVGASQDAVLAVKAGDLTGDDRESVEVSALALHLVKASITYLNTILIQTVLRDAKWRTKLTAADLRGLSALFWTHLNLYGRLELDMTRHLDLELAGRTQPEDRRGADLRQGDGDGAAGAVGVAGGVAGVNQAMVVAGDEDQVTAAAGSGLLRAADLLVDRGHDQMAVGQQPGQVGDGQAR